MPVLDLQIGDQGVQVTAPPEQATPETQHQAIGALLSLQKSGQPLPSQIDIGDLLGGAGHLASGLLQGVSPGHIVEGGQRLGEDLGTAISTDGPPAATTLQRYAPLIAATIAGVAARSMGRAGQALAGTGAGAVTRMFTGDRSAETEPWWQTGLRVAGDAGAGLVGGAAGQRMRGPLPGLPAPIEPQVLGAPRALTAERVSPVHVRPESPPPPQPIERVGPPVKRYVKPTEQPLRSDMGELLRPGQAVEQVQGRRLMSEVPPVVRKPVAGGPVQLFGPEGEVLPPRMTSSPNSAYAYTQKTIEGTFHPDPIANLEAKALRIQNGLEAGLYGTPLEQAEAQNYVRQLQSETKTLRKQLTHEERATKAHQLRHEELGQKTADANVDLDNEALRQEQALRVREGGAREQAVRAGVTARNTGTATNAGASQRAATTNAAAADRMRIGNARATERVEAHNAASQMRADIANRPILPSGNAGWLKRIFARGRP